MWILSAPGSVAYLLGFRPFWHGGKQTGGFPDAGSGVVTLSSVLFSYLHRITGFFQNPRQQPMVVVFHCSLGDCLPGQMDK